MHPSKLAKLKSRRSKAETAETAPAVQRPHGTQFGIIDARIAQDESLPPNVKLVYMYLCSRADTARESWPSRARMAREIGISVGSVDVALKAGGECGLWTVQHDYDVNEAGKRVYHSNMYFLHDHGGTYKPGSGPGARKPGKPRGRHVPAGGSSNTEPPLAQTLSETGSNVEPNQYSGNAGPLEGSTSDASSVDAPAGAHEQARGRANDQPTKRIHIDRPTAVDERELTRRLVAASTAAMKKAGQPLGSRGRADIGAWVKDRVDTLSVDGLASALEEALQAGLAGDPTYSWLFEDLDKPVSYPNTDDGYEQLHDDYDGLPGATATIDSMWPDGYHPNTIAATINKQLSA